MKDDIVENQIGKNYVFAVTLQSKFVQKSERNLLTIQDLQITSRHIYLYNRTDKKMVPIMDL